jgi:hypothetical protein
MATPSTAIDERLRRAHQPNQSVRQYDLLPQVDTEANRVSPPGRDHASPGV